MPRISIVIVATGLLLSQALHAQNSAIKESKAPTLCANAFGVLSGLYAKDVAQELAATMGSGSFEELGGGLSGKVYRFTPDNAEITPIVVKLYLEEAQLDRDLRAMELLSEILDSHPVPFFYVAKVRRGPLPLTMIVDNITGTEMKALNRQGRGTAFANEAQSAYLSGIASLALHIETAMPGFESDFQSNNQVKFSISDPQDEQQQVGFWIKPNNVIAVPATGTSPMKLIIIDPY